MKVLYLVHDVSDAAVARRLNMLHVGGAGVTLAGFRRTDQPVKSVAGCVPVDFGHTRNGRFIQRVLAVFRTLLTISRYQAALGNVDMIMARNLEMLSVAVRVRAMLGRKIPIVYESLDIHSLLLGNTTGSFLRGLERWLCRHICGLITSSPAFVEQYFTRYGQVDVPVILLENKLDAQALQGAGFQRSSALPWRIGWFGIIRCRKSLELLKRLVKAFPGKVVVDIRGRPALDQIPDFHEQVAQTAGLYFHGAYKNPQELADIYQKVHFSWCIDMYEEGQNSSWLLPNRLYEGCAFAAVPIALAAVETGRFLSSRQIGVVLEGPLAEGLHAFFEALTDYEYRALHAAVAEQPSSAWVFGDADCRALVARLQEAGGMEPVREGEAA